ncbi:putative secreted protein [Corynebacterium diphtheriae BH8]|uniref:hypothetical protein n=1 Tax=Corynebacterium diphtheriae TaxID=1717 RepID=UPI000245B79A|nr:hypothetical protein [Corynebacterium diphtheriae]AEX48215.1 putative secreted protein [Corynebacterium diphtheriae BH8]MBG9356270.1 hypothetical protein [Corynebacterium diphtheriae bv. mitis]TBX16541.1 hypothetical protein BUW94_07415 [Corynebacterium diphtheriae]
MSFVPFGFAAVQRSSVVRCFSACAVVVAISGVSACSRDTPEAPQSTSATSSAAPSTTSASTTAPSSASASSSTQTSKVPSQAEAPTSVPPMLDSKHKNVQRAFEQFGALAPESLFAQFDTCDANGVQNSMACSGHDVGQFQFFKSDAKAASTTQLLTELRSSRVIEDTGRRVVGWSTLGGTAVITVVDNDNGLVMQQMVSTDEVDPAEHIYELGLAQAPKKESAAEPTPSSK